MKFRYSWRKMAEVFANSEDLDQTPRSVASDITKTRLFKYTEKLITEKLKIFRQKIQIFFVLLLKT